MQVHVNARKHGVCCVGVKGRDRPQQPGQRSSTHVAQPPCFAVINPPIFVEDVKTTA